MHLENSNINTHNKVKHKNQKKIIEYFIYFNLKFIYIKYI